MRGIEQFLQVDAATLGALKYAGTWNASTNTPTLASGVGVQGQYYVVSVAGSTNLDGETAWQVGDWAVFNGSVWQKVDGGSTGLLTTLTVTGNTYLATTSGDVGIGATSVTAIYGKTLQIGSGTSEATTSLVGSTGSLFLATVGATGQLIARGGMALVLGSNDVERARIDTSGNVGIGTSSPGSRLTVAGNVEIRGGAGTFFGDATNATFPSIKSPALNTIGFFLNSGAETARIDASGNVGIGIASPAYKLDVVGSTSTARFGKLIVVDDTPFYTGANINSGANSLGVGSTGATHVGFFTNNLERMRITSAGDVGIGTSSPSNTLTVQGSIAYNLNGTTDVFKFFTGGAGLIYAGTTTSTAIAFITNGAEKARIDASGNVGIGTSTPSTYGKLVVWGGNAFIQSTTAGVGSKITLSDTNNSVSIESSPVGGATDMVFKTSALTRMNLDNAGNLGLGVTPSAWGFSGNLELPATNNIAFQGSYGNISSNAYYDLSQTRWEYITSGHAAQYQIGSAGQHIWYNAPSGTAGNAISFTQAMTLDASGNLALGQTSATYRLDIGGTNPRIRLNETTGYVLTSYVNTGGSFDVGRDNSTGAVSGAAYAGFLNVGGAYPLIFNTNGSERMRIPSAGGMVVGTAALATNATDGFLYVPTCAGTPTGTPTTQTGTAPIVIDTTNNKLYFYSGGQWRDAGP